MQERGLLADSSVYTIEQAWCGRLLALKGGDGSMLKDITLGQYFPGNTIVHRLDPRTKILAVILYIVALF